MDKTGLLKSIAETGYNVGFGAKKHFATYDIVEKVPGWIGFLSAAIGVYSLVFEQLSGKTLAATLVVAGIVGLYVFFYDSKKMDYDRAGRELTQIFNRLRDLYRDVQASLASDLTAHEQNRLCDRSSRIITPSASAGRSCSATGTRTISSSGSIRSAGSRSKSASASCATRSRSASTWRYSR